MKLKEENRKGIFHSNHYNIFLIIGMFGIFYNPPIIPVNFMHIVGFCSIVYLSLRINIVHLNVYVNKLLYIVCMFIIILCFLALKLIIQSLPLSSLVFPLYFLLDIIPFSLVLIIHSNSKKLTSYDFLEMVLKVGLMQSILAILSFSIPAIQEVFVGLLIKHGYSNTFRELSVHRMYGFAGGLTYSTPVLQSFLALIALYFSFTKSKMYFFYVICLSFSAIVNARISLVILLIGVFLLIYISGKKINRIILAIVFSSILYILWRFVFSLLLTREAPETYSWLASGIFEILAFLKGENTGYFAYIMNDNYYQLPKGFSLIWGEGYRIMGGYRGISSDIGYINDLWFGGIIYLLLIYPLFFGMIYIIKNENDELLSFIGLSMIVLYPVINIKGIALSMNNFTNFLVVLYLMLIIRKKDEHALFHH